MSKKHQRLISPIIAEDLEQKMVLLAGPRQCGKTTLAKELAKNYSNSKYYNWDIQSHRKLIRKIELDAQAELWIFDEIHKNRTWRNSLKGIFDEFNEEKKILVTGSAKLSVYKKGGDSLQGRYFLHRLHPFTYAEINKNFDFDPVNFLNLEQNIVARTSLEMMLEYGSFPEPLLSADKRQAQRWSNNYAERLIREDIRDLESIHDLSKMELLYEILPSKVGSPLSINSLKEDLELSFELIKRWIEIFENTYACFRIPPLSSTKLRAVKKEQKLYLWDYSLIDDKSIRLENLVALHLLRFCHWLQDVEGRKVELRYFRDTRGHEVDFIVLEKNKPWFAVEVKSSSTNLDKNMKYLLERVKIPYAFQIVNSSVDRVIPSINGCKIRISSIDRFLANLV